MFKRLGTRLFWPELKTWKNQYHAGQVPSLDNLPGVLARHGRRGAQIDGFASLAASLHRQQLGMLEEWQLDAEMDSEDDMDVRLQERQQRPRAVPKYDQTHTDEK